MFKYYLYKNLRNVMFLFWSLIFPLVLMTCMYVAFGNVYEIVNSIDPRPTVLVMEDESEFSEGFKDVLLTMSDEDAENQYFILTDDISREEAEKRGYTFLNFIEHYPNMPEYIKDRLHKYL